MSLTLRERFDSWVNALTGVGAPNSRTDYTFQYDSIFSDEQNAQVYNGDIYYARGVEAYPKHALRQGFTVETGDETVDAAVMLKLRTLGVSQRCFEAWTWSRAFGGGALLLGVVDGKEVKLPVDPDSIKDVHFVASIDKREIYPDTYEPNFLEPRFGEPATYRLSRTGAGVGSVDSREVHASRIIRFDGLPLDRFTRRARRGWGASLLEKSWDKLKRFNSAFAAADALLQEASQGVFKMEELYQKMAADKGDLLRKRLQLMDTSRSISRSIILDTAEDYTRVAAQFSGVPDTLNAFMLLLSGAWGIPVTILLGQSPAGMNATGESDTRMFYDEIKAEQTNYLKPKIEHIVKLILLSKCGPTGGVLPDKVEIKFNPLRQPTPSEDADLRNKQAQTDALYIDKQVVTPEEIAVSRFGDGGYSIETTVGLEMREAVRSADVQPEPGKDPVPGA